MIEDKGETRRAQDKDDDDEVKIARELTSPGKGWRLEDLLYPLSVPSN